MFLLILTRSLLDSLSFSSFTFHNVSINSVIPFGCGVSYSSFTFHNVSINSKTFLEAVRGGKDLHSTMFLLIPGVQTWKEAGFLYLHSTMFPLIQGREET